MSMLALLSVNLALTVIWMLLNGTETSFGAAVGFVVGFVALSLLEPEYGRRVGRGLGYFLWLLWQIVLSGWQVTVAILTPGHKFTPGIVAVPIRSTERSELILLASSITLTPGTISVESGYAPSGERVLFVHSLLLRDPDSLRTSIRDDMERRILLFMRRRQPQADSAGATPGVPL